MSSPLLWSSWHNLLSLCLPQLRGDGEEFTMAEEDKDEDEKDSLELFPALSGRAREAWAYSTPHVTKYQANLDKDGKIVSAEATAE